MFAFQISSIPGLENVTAPSNSASTTAPQQDAPGGGAPPSTASSAPPSATAPPPSGTVSWSKVITGTVANKCHFMHV